MTVIHEVDEANVIQRGKDMMALLRWLTSQYALEAPALG